MKQITHKFTLIPPSSIEYQRGQTVTLTANPVLLELMASKNCTFEQEYQLSEAGAWYECSFRAPVTGRHDDIVRYSGQKTVIRIDLSDGTVRYIGSKSDPLLIRVTPYPKGDLIEAEFSLPEPVEF